MKTWGKKPFIVALQPPSLFDLKCTAHRRRNQRFVGHRGCKKWSIIRNCFVKLRPKSLKVVFRKSAGDKSQQLLKENTNLRDDKKNWWRGSFINDTRRRLTINGIGLRFFNSGIQAYFVIAFRWFDCEARLKIKGNRLSRLKRLVREESSARNTRKCVGKWEIDLFHLEEDY